jgi:hypothetical protein
VKFFELEGNRVICDQWLCRARGRAREFKPDVIARHALAGHDGRMSAKWQLNSRQAWSTWCIIAMSGSPEFRQMAAEHGITGSFYIETC